MASSPWYRDAKELQARLNRSGSWEALSRDSGVSVNTLKSAGGRFGVKTPFVPTAKPKPAKPKVGESVSREELLELEVKDLRAQVAQARKLEVFDQRAAGLLEEFVIRLKPSYTPLQLPVDKDLTPHAHVLQYSDLHAAERVSHAAMNGLNEYNWEIMLERHRRLARAIRSFKKNRPYPIPTLHILGLGDMVTGDIHDELRETNEVVIAEAAVRLGKDMAQWIADELVPLYDRITIDTVVGNHGRISAKPEYKNAAVKNWDWVAYKVMELALEEYESVTVRVPTSLETVVEVFDKKILLFHGDGIQSSMVGVPWGGIIRRTAEMFKSRMAQGTYVDHFACGHWHEANVVGQRRIWVNGSLKGPDEYSLKRHGGGQLACQLLHTFHPTRGLVGTDYLVVS